MCDTGLPGEGLLGQIPRFHRMQQSSHGGVMVTAFWADTFLSGGHGETLAFNSVVQSENKWAS